MAPAWLTARPVAHRGLHDAAAGRVENTLPAAAAAAARGYAIEVDLQLSADGEAMVFHDDTLDRLTDATGPLRARTAADLATVAIRGGDARIPTLDALLATVAGRVPLVLELKSDWSRRPAAALVARVVDRLAGYGGPAALMSFDPDIVAEVRRVAPHLTRGIVADRADDPAEYPGQSATERFALRHLLHAPRTRPDFVAYDVHALPMPAPTVLRRLFGRPLLTWTVRSLADLAWARGHADQIIFEGFDADAARL
jgi:glycerophosphoryl diester phosphodiesterase